MKYAATVKNFKRIAADIRRMLKDGLKVKVYKFMGNPVEVSFTDRRKDGSLWGCSYGCDQCSPGLLKRMAALIKQVKHA